MPSKTTVWSREGLFPAAAPLFWVHRAPSVSSSLGFQLRQSTESSKHHHPVWMPTAKGGEEEREAEDLSPSPLGCCQSPSVWAFDGANSQGVGAGRPESCFRPPQHCVLSVQVSGCHISFPWCALHDFKGLLLVHRGHRAKVNGQSLTSPSPTKEEKRGERDF